MFKSSAKSKARSESSSPTHLPLEKKRSEKDQPDADSLYQTEQPRATHNFSVNQEGDDAIQPDLGSLVDDLRVGLSTMSMKGPDPGDNQAWISSEEIPEALDGASKSRAPLQRHFPQDSLPLHQVTENRAQDELQGMTLRGVTPRIAYRRGPFSYGTRRIPEKRFIRPHVKRPNHDEWEARRAALDIADQRMKESEARILARQKKRLEIYSNPRIERGVELAWPLLQYAARRSGDHRWPMLFFDITRDPSDPTAGAISLRFEGDQEIPEDLLLECMELAFSPTTKFSMIKMRGQESELDQLGDVMVQRLDGIRVIDIFSAIFKAYNVPLTLRETFDLHDLINSSSSVDAYHRRSRFLPIQDQDVFRVDLLGKKTLFNGISFDQETGRFYFRLTEQHPHDIALTALF